MILMGEYKVIDLSHHNTVADFMAVKNTGVYGVIIRAGYGREVSQKDRKFEEYYSAAKAVGLHIGAYWYSYADSVADAAKEATACLACIQGKQFDFPVYYDLEESSIAALGKDTCTQIAQTFCNAMEQAGYWAGVYANTNWFTNYLDHATLWPRYTVWLADYRTNYNTTLGRDMHQYTSTGSVAGISGNVDCNRCTRDFPAEIGSLYGGASSIISQPTEPDNWVHCTGDNVNVRADAHTAAAVVERMNKGNGCEWYADDGWGWSKVKVRDTVGWVSNLYLDKPGLSKYKVGECTGNRVNVREGRGTNHKVLRQVNKGNLFDIIDIYGGWYHVNVAGIEGYISKDYVKVRG